MASFDLERSLTEALAEMHGEPRGSHPELDQLSDLLHGELDATAAEVVRDHLESCRVCTQIVLDLELLTGDARTADAKKADASVEPDPPSPADFEVAAAYRRLSDTLADTEAGLSAAPPPARAAGAAPIPSSDAAAPPPSLARRWWPMAVAALASAACLILALRVAELERVVSKLEAPSTSVPILYLQEARRFGPPASFELGASPRLVIVLPLAQPDAFESYQVVVLDSSDRELWRGTGLEPSELGALRLGFSRKMLAPGDYRLRFSGEGSEGPETLTEIPIDLK